MKRINIFLLFAGFMIGIISCNISKSPVPEEHGLSGDTLSLIAEKLQQYIDNGRLSCITYMLIKDDVVIQRENFGFMNIEEQIPDSDSTIFRIFSMTKPITAATLMILHDEGKFRLDDRVSDYIPEFKGTLVYTIAENGFTLDPQINPITIRNLLTHTSGLVYGFSPNSYVDSIYRITGVGGWDAPIGDKVKKLADVPLKFQPGTKWEYGLSIDVAGYLVEVLSGMPLNEFMKSRLFEPLGMVDTDFFVPEEKYNRFATLYFRDREGKLQTAGAGPAGNLVDMNEIFKKPTVHFSGGGGLVSTAEDYARFCRMLANGGELDGVRILEESTVELIMSDQLPEGVTYGDNMGYGLGGDVNLATGEYGWSGAASTRFWIDPENNMILILLTQLMPYDGHYATEVRDIVRRAMISKDTP